MGERQSVQEKTKTRGKTKATRKRQEGLGMRKKG